MGGYINNSFTLLLSVEKPCRAFQRVSWDIFKEMVHTFLGNSRFVGCAIHQLPEHRCHFRKFALKNGRYLVPFGHDIVNEKSFLSGRFKCFLQLKKILRINSHWLIGKHIDTGFHGLFNILGLFCVIPWNHHDITWFVSNHFFEETGSCIDLFNPCRWIFSTGIIPINSFEVFFHIVTFRSIHINGWVNLWIHRFLYQSCMKMPRIEGHDFNFVCCTWKHSLVFLLLIICRLHIAWY